MKTIADVQVGEKVSNNHHGEGVITAKTQRSVTVTFKRGVKIKNSYRNKDDYFYASDFS